MRPARLAVATFSLFFATSVAWAYNPPTDTAGPLTARIEGPAEVTETDSPAPVRVVLENEGDAPLDGTVELGVIDRWTAVPPGRVVFSLPAKGTVTKEFTITAGKGTYSAHYPVHAYVRFSHSGQELTAHPILVLQTKLPDVPRPVVRVEWQPFAAPADRELALWRLPVHRAAIQTFGGPVRVTPPGWHESDAETSASLALRSESLGGAARETVAMHPPWRDGRAGTMAAEFPLRLPPRGPIKLRFTTAVTANGDGDGVTFRVRVLPIDAPPGFGEIVYERHSAAKIWGEPAEADLSRYAGKAIRLQLESHPGPKQNTSFDQSFWAEPILIAGTPAAPVPFPPAAAEGSVSLGTVRCGTKQAEVRIWPGARGLFDTVVGFNCEGRALFFRGFQAKVLGGRIDEASSPVVLQDVKSERIPGGFRLRHHFTSTAGAFDLVGELDVADGVLRAKLRLENGPAPKPWQSVHLEDVALGPWSQTARQVYAGHGNVVRDPEAFSLSFDGHRLATSFVGMDFEGGLSVVEGVDVPPDSFDVRPQEKFYSLHTAHAPTFTLILTDNVWEGAKTWRAVNGLKAAGGVEKAAGRFVFDLWGGRYGESRDTLERSFRYGLTDAMVVWHNWQRWGYDYRLPDIWPPNPQLGTLAEMQGLADVCRQAGTLFAPHDNYIDFYPDADGFSYDREIAFSDRGEPVKAWINEGRGAQSYRYRADRAGVYLKRNLELIRAGLAPTAFFIDVWTSINPYDYWTADGQFVDRVKTRTTWGELFAWIRDYLGGHAPQISESGHDQLIGWVDGAQTNHLRVGEPVPGSRYGWTVWNWKCADAERTPWFDAAHHDRFILHGAGYSSRYEGGLDRRLHGIYSDDYIVTEVLTGHPAMVSEPFGQNVVRKYWLLHDLMRALAMKQIESVEYVADDLHRQHVRWSGGGEVWVNRGEADWEVEGHVLPQYGFLARVPSVPGPVEASIARRGGVIAEMVRAPSGIYVNGRLMAEGPARIRPRAVGFNSDDGRKYAFTVIWQADDPIPANYRPFLHVCDEEGEIISQAMQDSKAFEAARQGTIRAAARGEFPGDAKPGTEYELRAGLYDPAGPRLALAGPDDGDGRVRLGKIRLEGTGNRVTKITFVSQPDVSDPVLARRNPEGKPVDFGAVVTAGGVRITRDGPRLLVTPLPNAGGREFQVRLRPAELGWTPSAAAEVEVVAEDGKTLARQPLAREGDTIVLTCRGDAFQYRLVP